jgi:Zn finger protein HypA/HybF involved in hydrogenase expression
MSEILICTPGYVAALEAAKQRIAKNQKQGQCPKCKRWFWPEQHDFKACAGHPLDTGEKW